ALDAEAIRREAAGSKGRLGAVVGHPRTLAALERACAELRRCDEATLGAIARRGGLSGDLAKLVVAVRRRLNAHGLADSRDLALAALRAAEGVGASALGLGTLVCFDLPRTDPLESAILRALGALRSDRVLSSVPAQPGCTRIVACADPDEEARAGLRCVISGLEAGVAPWRFALVYPTGTGYARTVHQQLAGAGVATNGPELRRLDRTMTGHCLLGLLDLVDSRWTRDEVVAWLSCAPLVTGPEGRPVPATQWDAVSAEAGVVRGAEQWRDRLHRVTATGGPGADEARAMARFVDELMTRTVARARTWTAHVDWSLGLLARYLPVGDEATGWGPTERAGAEQVVGIVAGLRELDTLSDGVEVSVTSFRLAVRSELERTALDTRDLDDGGVGDGVFIGPIGDVRGMRFASTIVVGLADALVPGMPNEDALVPDAVCALDPAGVLRTRAARRLDRRDELVAALATGATDRVATYPRVDPRNGRPHTPSRWLADLAGHGTVVEQVASFSASIALAGPALSRADRRLRALASVAASGSDPAASAVARSTSRLVTGLDAIRQRAGRAFTRFDGAVGAGLVTPFDPQTPVSATRFETYASCPRRYLLGRVLGLERRPRPELLWAIEPLERGTLLHTILEDYVNERIAGTPRSLERLLAIAENRFTEAETAGLGGKALLWRLEKAAMRRDLRIVFIEEGDLEPLAAELAFGTAAEESDPAVSVPVATGREVRFRGSADRVDRTTGGALVVSDYKTGRQVGLAKLARDPLDGGTRLQLPLYAMAARARFGADNPVVARYWLVSGERQAPRYAVALSDAVEARFRDVVGTIAAGVDGGAFPGVPGPMSWRGFEACNYCDFDVVCPSTREREWSRKRFDPALRPVVDLRDGPVPDDVAGAITTELLTDEVEVVG
ncbi:MAG TPA: PD-(D/E)XK nuclease family protein, partial [Acidimicrobiales bacterium]|nr:PD-(D/E)XK nuclease family protein [Acidimicrobiales bacterium]